MTVRSEAGRRITFSEGKTIPWIKSGGQVPYVLSVMTRHLGSYVANRCASDDPLAAPRRVVLAECLSNGDRARRCVRRSRACARNREIQNGGSPDDGRTHDKECSETFRTR